VKRRGSGRISEDSPLVHRITDRDEDFPFISVYLMLLLWKHVTMSEYVQKNKSVVL
jgi:hypothetical protein